MIQHTGTVRFAERYPAREIRWCAVRSPFLQADIAVHYLTGGSVDPLVPALLSAMGERGGSATLSELVATIGWRADEGARVIAEVLSLMCRYSQVSFSVVDGVARFAPSSIRGA